MNKHAARLWSTWLDSSARKMARGDSNGAVFIKALLISFTKELFRFEHEQTKFASGELITIDTSDNPGSDSVGYATVESVGDADIVAPDATEIPSADVRSGFKIIKAETVATSFHFSTQDLRQASMQGNLDIAGEKARSARRAFDVRLDALIRNGVPALGMQGILNLSDSKMETATTGDWSNTATTPAQISADVRQAYNSIYVGTRGVYAPDTAVFSTQAWQRLTTEPYQIGVPMTIMEWLMKAYPGIKKWTDDVHLDDAGEGGNGDAFLLYLNNRDAIRAAMPMILTPAGPLEQKGLVYHQVLEARYAGLKAPLARTVCKMSGI